jgi:hypothetical protein
MIHATSFVLFALLAQAAPPSASPEAKAKAQVLLKEGAKLYEKGELLPALDKFNEAYAEFQSPKLLFNIGQASRDLGRFVEAMTAFDRFLEEAPDAPSDMIAEAKQSVSELLGKLGKLRIQCSKDGAEISVDGKLVGVAPLTRPVWAVQGNHQVTARHPATAPAVEDVEVNVGWVHTVVMNLPALVEAPVAPVVVLPPKPPAPKPQVEIETSVPPAPEPVTPEAHRGRTWTWVAAGSAVVFAGTAVGLGLATRSKFDSLNERCGRPSVPAGQPYLGCSPSQVNEVLLFRNLTNVSWGLAAAAAATAGVLFFVEGRSVTVAPMAGETTGLLARVEY